MRYALQPVANALLTLGHSTQANTWTSKLGSRSAAIYESSRSELTAREMRHLTLEDGLELVILYAEKDDAKFERAACRWLSRLTLEREGLTLAQAQLATVALRSLEDAPATSAATLRSVVGSADARH